MKKMRRLNFLILTVSAAVLTACTSLLGGEELKVRPINNMSGLTGEPRDPFYESAAAAINQRDYGRALDYLQEAKARNPGNIKVLNALGVVYDKLGRFDLSARYYAQAQAIDPNSRVVAANLGYSKALQGFTAPSQQASAVTMELPANFNNGPSAKPTVLASAPPARVAVAMKPTQNATIVVAPPAAMPSVPLTGLTDNVTSARRTVQIAQVSAPEPTPVASATPVLAAVRAAEASNTNMPAPPPATAAKPVAEKAAIPVQISSKVAGANPPAEVPAPEPKPVAFAAPGLAAVRAAEPSNANISAPPSAIAAKPVAEMQKVAIATPPRRDAAGTSPQTSDPKVNARARSADLASAVVVPLPVQTKPVVEKPVLPAVAATGQPQLRRAAPLMTASKKMLLIGQPVRVMNASGKPDRVGVVSRRLGALGWTIRLADAGRVQAVTTLVYNPRNAGVAKAMQRTLPFPVRLVAESGTNGMRLVVGRDYLSWKPKGVHIRALWQKGQTIASLRAVSGKPGGT